MQLRFECSLTGEEYVSQQAWRNASLTRCPLHPNGGCGFARHGSYERRSPPGTFIARWYCPRGHRTFSLLPDCLAARLPGTLAEVEAVVGAVEQAESVEAACSELRLEIELPGVLRWVRRRVQAIHASLNTLKGLLPELFGECVPRLGAFAERLGVIAVLPALRHIAAPYLRSLPVPLGFRPRCPRGGKPDRAFQHSLGPDPPTSLA
ncbi:MAG: hypothetical protein WCD24_20985 [Serratia inhibens]|uniref:hypothetical protein n=1 Tax=Serratia inhibens TaxID=2338073 RepID=UPI003C7DD8F4